MNFESLDEVKKLYFRYRMAANLIENPYISRRASRKAATIGWERKVANWQRRAKI